MVAIHRNRTEGTGVIKPSDKETDMESHRQSDFVKLTANLPREVVEALRGMARAGGTSMTEQLRKAISTEKWLRDIRRDHRVLLQDSAGNVREVIFKD